MSRLLVTQYQAEVEKIIRYGGSKKETSIRNAFERLLNDYCKPRNYLLIPELDFKTKFNTTVFPDGTVKDAIRLEHGWWESKDQHDKLDEEIEKKLEKGYPDENILFEDSQTAVLIQHSREQLRVSMRDAEALDGLISTFVDYERPEVRDFRAAIVKFREDVPYILEALRDIITQQEERNTQFRERRNAFLEVCRQSINPEIEIFDIHEMLIQHILTEDIFTNIFHESQFHRENNIARELSEIITTFFTGATHKNTLKSIERYYAVIRRHSENIANHHEKQKFLKAVYENFYKAYNPKAADRLGIVYTPNEIVCFMIESADYLVHKHFGKLLSDPGVEILDPCTGTGTYTDWGLIQVQTHYNDPTITKESIFYYTYAVLHHPTCRSKYELNLKREFPRLPFYADFHQWATWGKALMDLHLNYETIKPYGLRRVDVGRKKSTSDTPLQATLIPIDTPDPAKPIKRTTPKAKLKADKTEGKIILDTETTLEGIPAAAWDYKLGNRSALEWILDQYKEKTPKDPTIAKLFNTYKFADYKEHVIDLLQ